MASIVKSGAPTGAVPDKAPHTPFPWRAWLPVVVTVCLALMPAPAGLPQHQRPPLSAAECPLLPPALLPV